MTGSLTHFDLSMRAASQTNANTGLNLNRIDSRTEFPPCAALWSLPCTWAPGMFAARRSGMTHPRDAPAIQVKTDEILAPVRVLNKNGIDAIHPTELHI